MHRSNNTAKSQFQDQQLQHLHKVQLPKIVNITRNRTWTYPHFKYAQREDQTVMEN